MLAINIIWNCTRTEYYVKGLSVAVPITIYLLFAFGNNNNSNDLFNFVLVPLHSQIKMH